MNPTPAPPLVLLACRDEWLSRSLATVFEQNAYAVARVQSGERALRLARQANPDVVVLEEGNGELDALVVCAALTADPLFDHTVPIVITSAAPVTTQTRHAAYAAGAWEYCSHPVDLEALMLKLATFRRARSEGVAKSGARFLDGRTGLFTRAGLERLAEQVGARARRKHEPLACLTLAVGRGDTGAPTKGVADEQEPGAVVVDLFRSHARRSDIVAQLNGTRLVILAPDTDAEGARLLIKRLRDALDAASRRTPSLADADLRVGYSAVSDLNSAGVEATELVRRAVVALDHVQSGRSRSEFLSFDDLPPGAAANEA